MATYNIAEQRDDPPPEALNMTRHPAPEDDPLLRGERFTPTSIQLQPVDENTAVLAVWTEGVAGPRFYRIKSKTPIAVDGTRLRSADYEDGPVNKRLQVALMEMMPGNPAGTDLAWYMRWAGRLARVAERIVREETRERK